MGYICRSSTGEAVLRAKAKQRGLNIEVDSAGTIGYHHKLSLFLSHGDSQTDEIPDPYYSGEQGFEQVLDLIEQASDAVLNMCAQR